MKRYELSRQKNIRDLGGLVGYNGLTIKYGRIYRGGSLHKVNEDDVKVIDSFHLTDIVDFRGEDEFIYQPDYPFNGVTRHSFPAIEEIIKKEDRKKDDGNLLWFVGDHTSGFEHMKIQYANLVKMEKSLNAYRNLFRLLEQDNKVIYYHCSQGKDRAGLASYFIESVLGVSEEDKIKDYLLSNEAMEKRVDVIIEELKEKSFFDETYRQSLLDVFAAKLDYLNSALSVINELHGGLDNFLRNVLFIDVTKMREMYLE